MADSLAPVAYAAPTQLDGLSERGCAIVYVKQFPAN